MESPIPISALPPQFRALEEPYGTICYAEEVCPGVYEVLTKSDPPKRWSGAELIVVMEDAPAISLEARSYGMALPTAPGLLVYPDVDYYDKATHVVTYEIHTYLAEHGLPLPAGTSLLEDRLRGMEICPEYFGPFPVPEDTPWGRAIRHDRLWNGLYWLETEEAGWVLAIAYPLCEDLLAETEAFAMLDRYGQEDGIDRTLGFRFYRYEMSCIPLFELLDFNTETWAPKIDAAALRNAVLTSFPLYARRYAEEDLGCLRGQDIPYTPGAGTEFYHFPQADT